MTERGGRYLFHIVEEVERRGMPTELALLPFIESAFNPQAMSIAKASGMWQFMPATGRDFELTQNMFRDDRRDVLASTRAALDYLQRLHGMFGDWHLALAAYNWGEGNVQRAIARNQKAGKPTDYLSLRMPAETRDYVPKLQAVKNIVARPEAFALALPALENHPYFLTRADRARHRRRRSRRGSPSMPLDEFQALNPQMNKPVILAAGTPQVLLPYDNANRFVRDLGRAPRAAGELDRLGGAEDDEAGRRRRQVGMSEAELREVNRIPPRMLVKAGSTLLVPRGAHARGRRVRAHRRQRDDGAGARRAGAAPRCASRPASRGDSVAAVARRYGVSAAQVAQWNKVGAAARASRPAQRV